MQVQRVGRGVHTRTRLVRGKGIASGLLFNMSFDRKALGLMHSARHLQVQLRPQVLRVAQMPWNIAWPPLKNVTWRYTLQHTPRGSEQLVVESNTPNRSTSARVFTGFISPSLAPRIKVHKASSANATISLNRGVEWLAMYVFIQDCQSFECPSAADGLIQSITHNPYHAFKDLWQEAKRRWEYRWRSAFDPTNKHYSGSLPTLHLSPSNRFGSDIVRIYYSSCVTLLAMERDNYKVVAPRVYLSGYGTIQPMYPNPPQIHGGSAVFYWVSDRFRVDGC